MDDSKGRHGLIPKLEHLHIYRWNAEKKGMFCWCGKPIPVREPKVIWK